MSIYSNSKCIISKENGGGQAANYVSLTMRFGFNLIGDKIWRSSKGVKTVCRGSNGKFEGQGRHGQGTLMSLSANHCNGHWETQRWAKMIWPICSWSFHFNEKKWILEPGPSGCEFQLSHILAIGLGQVIRPHQSYFLSCRIRLIWNTSQSSCKD